MKGVDESFDGSFGGIGIEFNVLNDTVVIVNTIAGGPSAQVGLLPGDRIVGIDGQRAVGLSRAEVPRLIARPSGTQVRLEVSRHAVKEPLAFTVTRGDIPLHTVDAAYKGRCGDRVYQGEPFRADDDAGVRRGVQGDEGRAFADPRSAGQRRRPARSGGRYGQLLPAARQPDRLDRGARGAAPAYTAPVDGAFSAGRSWCSSTRTRLRPARS